MSSLISVAEFKWFPAALEIAARFISEGKVIALPTDTVYGLAAAAQNTQAIRQVYKIKGRDQKKPLAICVDSVKSVSCWGKANNLPSGLLDALLPGPVTIVLERTSSLNPELNPGIDKVGIRIPDSEFVLQLCRRLGTPLALTSANASNKPSCLDPEEFRSLWPHLAGVFHSGRIGDSASFRAGSTVVDLSVPWKYHILRPGSALASTKAVLEHFAFVEHDEYFTLKLQETYFG
ncbi:yrdC domain-containing protein, mitochondrial [Zootermopsis nevadensis]|uniref:Threonylcarbamoyl-AMP synthase n=1 Tax=Zootermopsis nevadensis TaxID=136037 RepID=A0A067QW52_ZOONE|nr:yrdC domain-containing protein, mitochondrial [Zootermopsis nevadensis]KDR14324.1 YrdC domain-containing protein, mitochondrial [Zootermopsis nevadensis]